MHLDRTNDQEIFEEFLRRLSDEQVRTSREGYVELSSWEDVELEVPLRLQVTPQSLGEHLRAMERDGELAFPEAQPIIGALQLFLVHLDEAIRTRKPGQTELVPDATGVSSVAPS
ncbi:hypothetical protein [Saccharopolyspora rectivirgula]|jgi:hypothetical protein|uniref:Uncharacterized protein n=1 Tax=Saccharopolyspora rectivirgula TaxID=28042 RepID=A0A073AW16_9PSEU|nr:hypothetical protein [Saccharopolyspora rectivirgula]KEI43998.1 hypothetical protein GU90_13655 [Saccharopolyspora rectivirgula]